jgi:hypothetical protein
MKEGIWTYVKSAKRQKVKQKGTFIYTFCGLRHIHCYISQSLKWGEGENHSPRTRFTEWQKKVQKFFLREYKFLPGIYFPYFIAAVTKSPLKTI